MLKEDGRLQYGDAAAALASDGRTAAEHLASRAEAAAEKLEGRAGGTYQAQMEHAAVRGPPHCCGPELQVCPATGLLCILLLSLMHVGGEAADAMRAAMKADCTADQCVSCRPPLRLLHKEG